MTPPFCSILARDGPSRARVRQPPPPAPIVGRLTPQGGSRPKMVKSAGTPNPGESQPGCEGGFNGGARALKTAPPLPHPSAPSRA
jgi:hypothetical protein